MSKVLTVCVAKTQIIQHENTKIISMMTGDTPKDRQVTVSGPEEARERERECVCVCGQSASTFELARRRLTLAVPECAH